MTPPPAERRTRHVADEELRAVIEHYDDPDHPDALTVREARDLLADVQRAVEDRWAEYLERVRTGDLAVVRDTGSVVVFRDPTRRAWDELLDAVDCYDQVDRTVARVSHHQAATRLLDREFEGADPLLVRKPEDADAGQRFVEAVVTRLLRAGVPPEEAWAYYGLEVRGYDLQEWTDRCGYDDRVTVADAAETARDRLGE